VTDTPFQIELPKLYTMRHFLLILVASTNVLISCGQSNTSKKEVQKEPQQEKPKGDRAKINIKGDVGSIVETTSRMDYSQFGETKSDVKTTYVFNEMGNKTEYNSYTNNELMEKTVYQYDEKGRKIKELTSGLVDNFNYGSNDSLIEWTRFRDNQMEFRHIYTYNPNGNLIQDESNDGLLTTYEYNQSGDKTETDYFVWGKAQNYKKDLKRKIIYKYDNNKNVVGKTDYTPAVPSFSQPEQTIQSSYRYDNKGNLIEAIDNGVKHLYKYDVNGNQIEETGISAKGEVFSKITYKYEYDAKMNWTKQTKFENGQSSVVLRKIIYGIGKTASSVSDNLTSLRKLDGSSLNSEFFGNPIIKKRLLSLLGKERYAFMEGHWSIGAPTKLENDVLVNTGCMSHFCPSTNFIVVIDIPQNTFHVGIRDNDKVKLYTENESNKTQWIKQRIQHWVEYGSD